MKYLVIMMASKKECPPGIQSEWSYSKIPSHLWKEWERKEIDEDITPDIYTDNMDATIENYSKNYPEYYWEWRTETK